MNTLRRFILLSACLAAISAAHATQGDLDPLNVNVVGSFVLATAVQPDGTHRAGRLLLVNFLIGT